MLIREFTEPLDEGVNDPNLFKAVFMAGPPGAGKNHVISALGLNAAGLKLMDIDNTLYYLMKSKKALDKIAHVTDTDYDALHRMEQARMSLLRRGMLGLTINTTGREPERIKALKDELEESGYDTFMVFVGVDKPVAASRVDDRRKFATDPKDTRPVTKPYFDAAYEAATKAASYYALLFGNQFAFIANNVPSKNTPIAEEEVVIEGPIEDYNEGLTVASKKLSKFLRKPLSPKAQEILDTVKSQNY